MRTLLLLATLVTSLAFAGSSSDKVDCKKMADYSKGIASLKETGVTFTDFHGYITTPKVQTFPIQAVSAYVYSLEGQTPDQVYASLLANCTVVGYKQLKSYFDGQQEMLEIKVEFQKLTLENQTLQKSNDDLTAKLKELQAQTVTAALKHIKK